MESHGISVSKSRLVFLVGKFCARAGMSSWDISAFGSSAVLAVLGYASDALSPVLQVGDGTTSVTLLAAEFLKQVKPYVEEGLHPQIIIRAFRTATQLVRECCERKW